jgi:hypothetical protein
MPSCAKRFSCSLLISLLIGATASCLANEFSADIRHAELLDTVGGLMANVRIDYQLSPTAKEALRKGVPLNWRVLLEIRRVGWLWDSPIYSQTVPYTLQFHALLNQYEVKTPTDHVEMFLTLNAALEFMAMLHDTTRIDPRLMEADNQYLLAIKSQFDRESLPVPLRPFAYLNPEWFLSSDWYLWPIQK